jgi:cysteine-rich repeat protein
MRKSTHNANHKDRIYWAILFIAAAAWGCSNDGSSLYITTDTSGADTSGADTSGADTSGADTSGADTSGADASEVIESSCSDSVKNGAETDIDCGGPDCGACDIGATCAEATDCLSGVCADDLTCAAPTCDDLIKNGAETDTDCGGSDCPACDVGMTCAEATDCVSSVCDLTAGVCLSAECADSVQNGAETDIDCGGPDCAACADGQVCAEASDCLSSVCAPDSLTCTAPACDDTVQNGEETDTDCGGSVCDACADTQACAVASDCLSGVCDPDNLTCTAPACDDAVQNGDELDVDCGGPTCAACGVGLICVGGGDCLSGVCTANVCQAPACDDTVLNGAETDIDCGGSTCAACADGDGCSSPSDCVSGVCTASVCQAPACDDTVLNGSEVNIDCGGSCSGCANGASCTIAADCAGGFCLSNVCADSDCTDGIRSGSETDIDCGGPTCGVCSTGDDCTNPSDCIGGICTANLCVAPTCGDGILSGSEVCDDSNVIAGDGCRADCRGVEVCGDGLTDTLKGEQCDDGNTTDGDGCSATCQLDPFVSVPSQLISGTLSCTTTNTNTGRKVGVDQRGNFFVVMKCGNIAYVAVSTDRGLTWSDPVSTGISNVAEVAIEGGSEGVAYVVAVISSANVLLSQTTDFGATWSSPTTVNTGVSDSEVSIDAFGDAIYIATVRNGNSIDIIRSLNGPTGPFQIVNVLISNAFHDIVVDKISGDVILVADTPAFQIKKSTDQGSTFGALFNPPGQAFYSDWTGSNGKLYAIGTSGDNNVDVISTSQLGSSTQVLGLPSNIGAGSLRSIDADALGNAYIISQLTTGEIQLDRMMLDATSVNAADARSVIAAGTAPAVGALPSNNGALVAYTVGTQVFGAVVVY